MLFHTIYNNRFSVLTTVFSVRKRLFCILDRDTEWTLSVCPKNEKPVHFRMIKEDIDSHMLGIQQKRDKIEHDNNIKSKQDKEIRALHIKVCNNRYINPKQSKK